MPSSQYKTDNMIWHLIKLFGNIVDLNLDQNLRKLCFPKHQLDQISFHNIYQPSIFELLLCTQLDTKKHMDNYNLWNFLLIDS